MAFTFQQLGIDGVARWMVTAERYRSELGRVMNTLYRAGLFVQDKFLSRVAALESMHMTWSGKTGRNSLHGRLTPLAKQLGGDVFEKLVPRNKRSSWVQKVVDERHDIAHHLKGSSHGNAERFFLSETVYWLFVICMLREADAPDACFEHLARNPRFVWRAEQIATIM
ncbi:HEPN domain-containing protein [Amycolatopsis sp. NPDC051061]|uniref:HEPN domain-containing protein n=1 Tax=Amycolatopsis sp. NPDC051061 TaxID=3155042 RepID=UPI0034395E3E